MPATAPARQRRKDDRRAGFVAAALAEFAAKGFAATRLEDVAQRAGAAKGTLYLYFDSKEALFEAVVREVIGPLLDRIDAASLAGPASSADLLRLFLRTLYHEVVATERRQIMRMLIADGARFPAMVAIYHREVISRGKRLLRSIVARGVERGEFRDAPYAAHPELLLGPAIMAAVWKMLFDAIEPMDLETLMAAHLDLLLHGMQPPPARLRQRLKND